MGPAKNARPVKEGNNNLHYEIFCITIKKLILHSI